MFEEKRENSSKHTPKNKGALRTIRLQIIHAMLKDDPALKEQLRIQAFQNLAGTRHLKKQLRRARFSDKAVEEILRFYGVETVQGEKP